MKSENPVRLSIDVPSELHRILKLFVVKNHLNIKNYVLGLIKEDLSEELEDYLLGELALKSEKEGSFGAEESKKFLKKLRKSATIKESNSPQKSAKNETARTLQTAEKNFRKTSKFG